MTALCYIGTVGKQPDIRVVCLGLTETSATDVRGTVKGAISLIFIPHAQTTKLLLHLQKRIKYCGF